MRTNYWSNTKFAGWIRGTKKPHSGTGKEWDNWDKMAKAAHPVRFWLAEEGLDHIQDIVFWPADRFRDVRCYFNNRFITKSHALTANKIHLKRGQWCDVSERFLPCMFDTLVDFVEIESAWMHIVWDDDAAKKYKSPWWARGPFHMWTWRSPEAGIAHLKWAMSLTYGDNDGIDPNHELYGKPTSQATAAAEVLDLYTWWKEVYPKRPDPFDVSGWSDYCEERRKANGGGLMAMFDDEDEERERSHAICAKSHEIEAAYEAEDTEMMTRLIKARHSLWT